MPFFGGFSRHIPLEIPPAKSRPSVGTTSLLTVEHINMPPQGAGECCGVTGMSEFPSFTCYLILGLAEDDRWMLLGFKGVQFFFFVFFSRMHVSE